MEKNYTWCAIGDSFTYLNDHLDETGYRLKKGYLTRTAEKLEFKVKIENLGKNGSSTSDWINEELKEADFYSVLLGTNDWYSTHTPLGTREDFQNATIGSILGNLAYIIENIRKYAKNAPIFVMNPVERGDFVYIENPTNNAHGSYIMENGLWLSEIAEAMKETVQGDDIYFLDLHGTNVFTPENAVHFKRLNVNGEMKDLSYPEYIDLPYNPENDTYPYPVEAINMTYDGLHPSDEGCEKIANFLAEKINSVIKK